jgi:Ca2+-binding EF-hand superfamily protein
MTGAKRVNLRKADMANGARMKSLQPKGEAKMPRETGGASANSSTTTKKKTPKNDTSKSAASQPGGSKTAKKRKANAKARQHIEDTDRDVELQANVQFNSEQRKVQVKQRSFSTVLNAGKATIAVADEASREMAEPPAAEHSAADDTGGFASGKYGMLLETKRAEKLCLSLALHKRHIEAMKRAFDREELLGGGEITTAEFFSMIHEQPRQLTKGLFEEVGLAREPRRLRFDEFVICVATIATWSKSELLHYAFKQFDVDESGVMDGRELRAFCEGLKNDSSFYFAKNVTIAREKLVLRDRNNHPQSDANGEPLFDIDANTLVDLEDLAKGSSEFQVAFYPLVQLQQNVRSCALGEEFWAKVAQRRHEVGCIVHYMRCHKGKLPSFSIGSRIIAYLMPFSEANARLVVHKLAVLKFAEEQRLWQEQAQARAEAENLVIKGIQEEGQT